MSNAGAKTMTLFESYSRQREGAGDAWAASSQRARVP